MELESTGPKLCGVYFLCMSKNTHTLRCDDSVDGGNNSFDLFYCIAVNDGSSMA
jgi:hypothetical protein